MNPWLQEYWRDIHARLLVYACDGLNGDLPPGLRARVDERLAIEARDEEKRHDYLPDVAITEAWDQPAAKVSGLGGAVAAAEPTIVYSGDLTIRHLEIVDSREHVITAIELLSPSNKEDGEARKEWSIKRVDYLSGGINLVEIDLLRGGSWVLPARGLTGRVAPGRVYHHVCVTRPPNLNRHEFYILPLRERLPAIRVPLRRGDPDVALDLQPLIDRCYEHGRYGDVIDYSLPPHPPLPDEEAAWASEILS